MGASSTPVSRRGRSLLGLIAPALWAAALLLAPGKACGQFRLFDLGAGTDYLSELQKSLTISSSLGTVTIFDPQDGSTVTGPLNGDPRLLNRKFDIEWQMSGPGVRLPFTLSTPRVIGGASIRPTLTLEALDGDFDLRFLNQRESSPNDALHGRGPMYGAELALRAESRTWFAETGYRYHSLPGTAADRSQPFTSPGAEVLTDESRLSRETHDVFTRVGYSPSEGLFTYTGVRYRKAHVEVKDDLRFVDAFRRETALSSLTKLDGSATEAMVGVEGRRGSFMGRTEITFNDKDYGVLATALYVRRSQSVERERAKADRIAAEIAPKLARIRDEFARSRRELPIVEASGVGRAYLAEPVRELLDKTERDLLSVFKTHDELQPLRDYTRDLFTHTRETLLASATQASSLSWTPSFAALRGLHGPVYLQARPQETRLVIVFSLGFIGLGKVELAIGRMTDQAQGRDIAPDLCVKTEPAVKGYLTLRHLASPNAGNVINKGADTFKIVRTVYRGLYDYELAVSTPGYENSRNVNNVPLNLVDDPGSIIFCVLVAKGKGMGHCTLTLGELRNECPNG